MKKYAVLVLVVLLLATGCSTWKRVTGQEEQKPMTKGEAPNAAYYAFPDIPIPKELELVRDKSFVYETANLRTGVLILSGNVDINSLEQYFKTNMAKNGWRFINGFKYATIMMNYVKDDRPLSSVCREKIFRHGWKSVSARSQTHGNWSPAREEMNANKWVKTHTVESIFESDMLKDASTRKALSI